MDGKMIEALSEREFEIITCLAEGLTNREIGDRLFLAPSTVKWYIRQLNQKLDTSTREDILEKINGLGLLETAPAPAETYVRARDNLPRQTTPFVGRDAELDEIHAIIEKNDVRLLTILAPGGMGKTRIALEAAEQQLNHFPDGVYFVPLQPLSDGANIIPQIAQSIGYQLMQDGREPKQQLLDFLSNKQLLLLMDNFEHLLDSVWLINEILQAAPDVKIITTSRERLNLLGETIYPLRGMEFPTWETPEDALHYDAVQLLVQAAQRVKHEWQVTTDNLDYVARVCRLTEGMPLGILLAASWLDVYGLERICDEIQKNADILETELRDVPERQRSIRAIFDYSWERLKSQEQHIFMKMSLFRGGYTLEAAESITGANARQLQSLVNKALITRNRDGRYDIHELLRQYAEKLLKEDKSQYRQSQADHCRFYLEMLAAKTTSLKGDGKQAQAAREITIDFENISLAWNYALHQNWFDVIGDCLDAMEIFVSYWKIESERRAIWNIALPLCDTNHFACLYIKALCAESADDVQAILALPAVQENPKLLRVCYGALVGLYESQRDYEVALQNSEERLHAAIQENDPYYLGRAYYSHAFENASTGNIAGWLQNLHQSHRIFEENQDSTGMMLSLSGMGTEASLINGDYRKAMEYAVLIGEIFSQLGVQNMKALNLCWMADSQIYNGQIEAAKSNLKKAKKFYQLLNTNRNDAGIENTTAYFACLEGNYVKANQHATEAINLTSNLSGIVHSLIIRSFAATAQNAENLVDTIRQVIYILPTAHPEQYTYSSLTLPALARHYMRQKRNSYAVEILSIALHHPRCPNKLFELMPFVQDIITELKGLLSPNAFDVAWERGKTMEFSPVIRCFMDEDSQSDNR